ncbi:MAG: VanW family protein [Actinobacteria bacterium]|nr:VanW family protein [Actinomycetota bacterium]
MSRPPRDRHTGPQTSRRLRACVVTAVCRSTREGPCQVDAAEAELRVAPGRAEIVDGAYVAPDETFSLNTTAGRRTERRGFVADGAIVGKAWWERTFGLGEALASARR